MGVAYTLDKDVIENEGHQAFHKGKYRNDNPYDWPMTAGWWDRGWRKAKDESNWQQRDSDRTGYIS